MDYFYDDFTTFMVVVQGSFNGFLNNISSPLQTFVELIRLNDEETLKAQTNENDDLFHWLKLQARSGVAEAEVLQFTSNNKSNAQNLS